MNDQINQDDINKTLWSACNTFRGKISADTYKDFILTMLFLKYISDVWQDHYDGYQAEYGDDADCQDDKRIEGHQESPCRYVVTIAVREGPVGFVA